MMKCVAVCGDSFGTGAGLDDSHRYEKSFGGVISSRLGLPLKVYARPGCCNFTIFLQVKKIIEQHRAGVISPLVIITLTNHSRLFFPMDSTHGSRKLDLSNVIYRDYSPYAEYSNPVRPIEFDIMDTPNFTSETISNIGLCLSGSNLRNSNHFAKFTDKKFEAIKMYFQELYEDSVKLEYDDALVLTMHSLLKERGIKHVILGYCKHRHRFIDKENFAEVHWGEICMKYPDSQGSMHCDETGHLLVADMINDRCVEMSKHL